MNIELRYNMVIHLTDTEVSQLKEGLKYIKHRFEHEDSGIYKSNCKEEFIAQLISQKSS